MKREVGMTEFLKLAPVLRDMIKKYGHRNAYDVWLGVMITHSIAEGFDISGLLKKTDDFLFEFGDDDQPADGANETH